MGKMEKAKDRLHYLFWKKIKPDERKQILIDLGMLPADLDMTPVWLRRGLVAAMQGKSEELWDAIMRCLPPDKQEPNPLATKTATCGPD